MVIWGAVSGGTIIAFLMLYRLVTDRKAFRMFNIACFSLLFGYVVSTAGYAILSLMQYGEVNLTRNDFGLSYGLCHIGHGLLLLFVLAVLLGALAHFERPLFLPGDLAGIACGKTLVVFIFFAALAALALLRGDLGYMGVYFVGERRISWLGALIFVALPPLAISNLACLVYLPNDLRRYRKIFWATFLIFIVSLIPTGRRVLIFTSIACVMIAGPDLIPSIRKRITPKSAVILVLLFVTLLYGYRIFYAMRICIWQLSHEDKPPLTEVFPYLVDAMTDSYFRAELQEKLMENTTQRSFYFLSYFAGLLHAHERRASPALGELKYSLLMAVPSTLFQSKTRILPSSQEEISHPPLGLPVFDGANSLLTAGLNDLGLLGICVYPIGVVSLYIAIVRKMPKTWPRFVCAFVVFRFAYQLLYVEDSMGGFVGSSLRDLFIVVALCLLIFKVPIKGSWPRRV